MLVYIIAFLYNHSSSECTVESRYAKLKSSTFRRRCFMYIYIYIICIYMQYAYIIVLLYNKNHKQDLNTGYDIWRTR